MRSLRTVIRRPLVLMLSLVQPLMWMLFFGFLFEKSVVSGMGEGLRYIDLVTPGICAMSVLFGASQSGVALIRDFQTGMFERILVTPASRWKVYGGKLSADVTRLLIQASIVGCLAALLGANLQPDFGATVIAIGALGLFAVVYAGFSSFLAVYTRAQESMAALIHLVNMPLLFTSTALVPTKACPIGLRQSLLGIHYRS